MAPFGASSAFIGKDTCALVDKANRHFDKDVCAKASGQIKVVEYMWPCPGETEPSQKASYYTKFGGQICGFGYYK